MSVRNPPKIKKKSTQLSIRNQPNDQPTMATCYEQYVHADLERAGAVEDDDLFRHEGHHDKDSPGRDEQQDDCLLPKQAHEKRFHFR